ncbi:MAG TPA: hypothetical protein VFC46_04605 [Humisphaera sp.]|nr:hypothetical protein [Humisphaera sp.]
MPKMIRLKNLIRDEKILGIRKTKSNIVRIMFGIVEARIWSGRNAARQI